MIGSHELKNRDGYLKKLIGFQDTEPVKVVTGIRRCGKSSLLKLMIRHLRETGVQAEQIVKMNFESHDFKSMTSDEVYHYVKERVVPGKRMYLFFDELQRIDAWEDAVNSFRVDLDCDIYVTGSNACLLSSEYSTYLSGRCVEIKMLPLSFREFLDFHNFEVRETSSALGGTRRQVFDQNGERYDLREVFDAYLRFGGMPGIADIGLDQGKALSLLEGIYSTVVVRDILEREKRRGQRQITDPALLRKIVLFLADNIGSSVSVSSIGNTLMNEGLLGDGKRKGIPSAHTVQAYIGALLESCFSTKSSGLTSRARSTCARWASTISWTSGLETSCWASATGTAAAPLRMWSTSNCSAGAMTWPSGRSTIRRWILSPPPPTTSSISR